MHFLNQNQIIVLKKKTRCCWPDNPYSIIHLETGAEFHCRSLQAGSSEHYLNLLHIPQWEFCTSAGMLGLKIFMEGADQYKNQCCDKNPNNYLILNCRKILIETNYPTLRLLMSKNLTLHLVLMLPPVLSFWVQTHLYSTHHWRPEREIELKD